MQYALYVESITEWLGLTHEIADQVVKGLIWPGLASALNEYRYKVSLDERIQYTHVLPMLACTAVDGDAQRAAPLAACWQFKLLAAQLLDDLQDGTTGYWQILSDTDKLMGATLFLGAAEQCLTTLAIDLENYKLVAGKMGQMTMIAAMGQRAAKASSIADYFKKVTYKTGLPFGSACIAGGIVGQASKGQLNELENFGLHIGVMRQIIDDCLDIEEDLYAGEWTLPIFHLLSRSQATDLKVILSKGTMSETQIKNTLSSIIEYGSLTWSWQQANERKLEAVTIANNLPFPNCLVKYAQF